MRKYDEKEFEEAIDAECSVLASMLKEKNRRYGNSALDPVRIFSKASPIEQLKVRIDDKLSRMHASVDGEQEDVVLDLLGYLLLLRVSTGSGVVEPFKVATSLGLPTKE